MINRGANLVKNSTMSKWQFVFFSIAHSIFFKKKNTLHIKVLKIKVKCVIYWEKAIEKDRLEMVVFSSL